MKLLLLLKLNQCVDNAGRQLGVFDVKQRGGREDGADGGVSDRGSVS